MPKTIRTENEPIRTGAPAMDDEFATKLKQQVDKSDDRMRSFHKTRENLIRRYVGDHYGSVEAKEDTKADPLNMVKMSANIYIPLLIMHTPRYRVRTPHRTEKGTAWLIQEDLNATAKDVMLRDVFHSAVVNSIFMFGIVKTGYSHGPQVKLSDIVDIPEGMEEVFDDTVEVPQLFVKNVSPDDYVVDAHAKNINEIQFEGDRYVVPLELAQGWFPDARLEEETTDTKRDGASKISNPSKDHERLFPVVELCDIFLPLYNVVLTFAPNQTDVGVLNEATWDGGNHGPYHKLWYHEVPDQIFPTAPAEAWVSLHDLLNDLARSIRYKVQRQKSIGVYGVTNQQDGERLQSAEDGDWVGVNNPEEVNQVELGGNPQYLENSLARFMNIFSQQAGNTDLLGGMNADARSATEANMLGQNASVRIQDMQNAVERFAADVGKTIGRLRWNDPFTDRALPYSIDLPGGHQEFTTHYRADTKLGRYDDYNLQIVPYSLRGQNPDQYARKLMEWWNQVVLPTAEIGMQQGLHLDVESFTEYMAEEMGVRQHDWFYRKGEAIAPGGQGQERGQTREEQEGGPAGRMASAQQGGGRPDVQDGQAREAMEHRR